jgi:hypothetical protein
VKELKECTLLAASSKEKKKKT